ncbi:MAG: hypothetical protein CVV02_01685 [Firmicutes bacterium HGW-Firmicutes-7]|nr:MAG: hypothetical protein CVV02_01685 [Firmicutes bacterium HGW-Firmicutes-7]
MGTEIFKDFEILAIIHVDKPHSHTHFIISSVSFETERKWQQSRKELKELKDYSNELCNEYGLEHSIISCGSENYR